MITLAIGYIVSDQHMPARAGPPRADDGHGDVSRYGHDLLAASDRGGAGTGGAAMMDEADFLAGILTIRQRRPRKYARLAIITYRKILDHFDISQPYRGYQEGPR